MQTKKHHYLAAAIEVFTRYGVKRTTMADIAEKAGVSRQTLYAAYPSKEEIFSAAMQQKIDHMTSIVSKDWGNCTSMGEKLDIYFQHAIVSYFEQIKNMPDAVDLIAGTTGGDDANLRWTMDKKKELLVSIFQPYSEQLASLGMSVDDLADFVQNTSSNFLFTTKDAEHLKKLLFSLKLSTLSLINES